MTFLWLYNIIILACISFYALELNFTNWWGSYDVVFNSSKTTTKYQDSQLLIITENHDCQKSYEGTLTNTANIVEFCKGNSKIVSVDDIKEPYLLNLVNSSIPKGQCVDLASSPLRICSELEILKHINGSVYTPIDKVIPNNKDPLDLSEPVYDLIMDVQFYNNLSNCTESVGTFFMDLLYYFNPTSDNMKKFSNVAIKGHRAYSKGLDEFVEDAFENMRSNSYDETKSHKEFFDSITTNTYRNLDSITLPIVILDIYESTELYNARNMDGFDLVNIVRHVGYNGQFIINRLQIADDVTSCQDGFLYVTDLSNNIGDRFEAISGAIIDSIRRIYNIQAPGEQVHISSFELSIMLEKAQFGLEKRISVYQKLLQGHFFTLRLINTDDIIKKFRRRIIENTNNLARLNIHLSALKEIFKEVMLYEPVTSESGILAKCLVAGIIVLPLLVSLVQQLVKIVKSRRLKLKKN